jgi:hypothetical protein
MKSFSAADGPHENFTHYVVAGPHEQLLCRSADERSALCRTSMAGAAAGVTPIRLLAYCIDDRWLRAVVQSPQRALSRKEFLAALTHGDATTKAPRRGVAKFEVVRSVPLATVAHQLAVIRHCHLAPVELRLAREPAEWPWSSHRLYLGLEEMSGFSRGWLATLLAEGPGGWPLAYRRLMSNPEEGEGAVTLPNCIVPILPMAEMSGDPTCLRALRRAPKDEAIGTQTATGRVFKSLVRKVCRTTGCDVRAFCENPAARRFRLERALLLERLTGNRKLMSVRELSTRLRCDRSWLYKTRTQCREDYPDLFRRDEDLRSRSHAQPRGAETTAIEEAHSKARRRRPDRDS